MHEREDPDFFFGFFFYHNLRFNRMLNEKAMQMRHYVLAPNWSSGETSSVI